MNILFVAHNFIYGNGQGRINLEVVRHALSRGHQVTLVADNVHADLLGDGCRLHRVRQVPNRPNILGVRTFVAGANRAVRQLRSKHDLVVAAGYTLTEAHDVNLCQFVHGAWIRSPVHVSKLSRGPRSWYQSLYTRVNARWERAAYRNARFVVPPSRKIARELVEIGVPESSVRVIHNGVDLQEFRPRTNEARSSWNLPDGVTLGLFAGDIRTRRKNLDTVLRSLAQLPDLHLAVVGSLAGSPFPEMARELGISNRVHFLDFRSDIAQIMRVADVFIFPSRYEAGTLVLLEAAASGLPVVTAQTAGGCEVFDNRAGRILDDPNDPAALSAAIRQITESPARLADASKCARAIAEGHAWIKMAQRYLELFEHCTAAKA